MNDKDIELLSRHLDGELDELSSRRVSQRLSAEPQLRSTFARMAAIDQRVKQAFARDDQVPGHIAALLDAHAVDAAPAPRRYSALPYAMAASLAAVTGLLLAALWQSTPAEPGLAQVLESTPSMAEGWQSLADGRRMRPVLSFQDVDGAWCREYLVSNDGRGSRGVACRDSGRWQTRIEVAAEIPGSSADYRPAGATDADAVADYLDKRADGIALSADEETTLIARDWND